MFKKATGELRDCRTGLGLATGLWPTTPLPLLKEGHGVSALNPVRNNKSCSFGGKIYLQTASETEHLLVKTTFNSTFDKETGHQLHQPQLYVETTSKTTQKLFLVC